MPGQAHDLRETAEIIEGVSCEMFLADRAFDANWLRENLDNAGIVPVIPPKSNRKFPPEFDKHSYKWRHLIENYFQKLKEFMRIALSYCQIWCLRVVGHAATWPFSVVSIPSLNVTPVMTLAR